MRRHSTETERASISGRFRGSSHSLKLIDAAHAYVRDLFGDIWAAEQNALKGRLFFPFVRRTYFDDLISSMNELLLNEFKECLNREFGSTDAAYEAGRLHNPLKDAAIQEDIEKHSHQITAMVTESIGAMREEFKQDRNKRILRTILKPITVLIDIARKILGS